MADYEHILVQSKNGVKTITLNRPDKRNALTPEMMTELTDALEEAADCHCGVLILTGAAPAFCAGLDLESLQSLDAVTPAEHRRDAENLAGLLRTLYDFPKPVIAAVNGPAIAGGMSLATIPDFTLATPEARFGFNEVRVGFVPAIAASFLIRQVGEKRTRDLLLTGRKIKAEEARAMGLVTEIVACEELMKSAQSLAQTLLLNSCQAMRSVKTLLAGHARRRLDEELEEAIAANALQRSSEDLREGVQAFLHRRKPEWPSLRALLNS
jgi:methylglutaconyl-CoA hydratase